MPEEPQVPVWSDDYAGCSCAVRQAILRDVATGCHASDRANGCLTPNAGIRRNLLGEPKVPVGPGNDAARLRSVLEGERHDRPGVRREACHLLVPGNPDPAVRTDSDSRFDASSNRKLCYIPSRGHTDDTGARDVCEPQVMV